MTLTLHRLTAATLTAVSIVAFSCSVPESSTHEVDADTGTTAAAPQDPQDIAAQRTRILVEKFLEEADRLRNSGQAEAARLELLRAQSLAPKDERIMQRLRAVHSELRLPEPSGDFAANQTQLYQIRRDRQRAEVSSLIDEANRRADTGDYARALELVRRAELTLEIGDDIDWGDLDSRVSGTRAEIESRSDDAETSRSQAVERDIQIRQAELSEIARARQVAQRDELIFAATQAFESRQFARAQELAFEAMQVDSSDQLARQIHEGATKALRESSTDRYYQDMAQAIRQMIEAENELKIPYNDTIVIDDEIQARARARTARRGDVVAEDPDDLALRNRIATETLSGLSFTEEDGSFDDVKTRIQTILDIPIIITPAAREAIEGEGLTVQLNIVAPITVKNLLDHMAGKSEQLAWTVNNNVVEITTPAEAGGQNTQVLHDVRDLVYPRTVFLPPSILEIPTADTDSEIPRTGGEGEEQTFFIEMDPLVQAIRDATDPKVWDTEGNQIDQTENGYLLVVTSPEMQARVRRVLDDLRSFATAVVKVDSKFLTVTRNFLQEVGVDFRGLGGSGAKGQVATLDDVTNGLDDNASQGFNNAGTADSAANPSSGAFFDDGGDGDFRGLTENFFQNPISDTLSPNGGLTAALVFLDDLQLQAVLRAVEKQEDVEELNGQTVTIQNNERGYVAVINQTSYIRDFDVEVAQAAFIADPKVDVIQDGIVLDVKPTINYDRKTITLDLSPTVAELVRPIPTFSTSLAGTTQPVTLQLPQLTVRSFATTATVPDGGSLLIGGLREVLSIERRAEVPILGKIPLLSFFFKQEGVVDENSSLMVLVTAAITDVREYVDGRR